MSIVRVKSVIATTAVLALLAACGGGGGGMGGGGSMSQTGFIDKALVADSSASKSTYSATTVDANLTNPWGIAFNPGGDVWVANEGSSTTTLYDGSGNIVPAYTGAPLSIGVAKSASGVGGPTGLVYNSSISAGSGSFLMPDGAPALFIYATVGGAIEGWDTASAATTIIKFDGSASGTVYTGLAIGHDGSGNYFLYAADFGNGKVDVFDHGFTNITPAGSFATPTGVPAGYVPFGIQNIPAADGSAQIYVAYAQQNAGKNGAVAGAGNGYVAVFDSAGTFMKLLISGGSLNAPWGMALAPNGFGTFSGALLVGNFGDGKINAYNISTGALMGVLNAPNGTALQFSGLWGIAFGNGSNNQPTTTLFYAAGVSSESGGVYGRIDYGTVNTGGGGGGGY